MVVVSCRLVVVESVGFCRSVVVVIVVRLVIGVVEIPLHIVVLTFLGQSQYLVFGLK